MEKSLEARLTELARRAAALYQDRLEPEYARQLSEAIAVCERYQQGQGDWTAMYRAVLDDGGIWEYAERMGPFPEDIVDMWNLETFLLICSCWLGCDREQDVAPQDMELRGENIPGFVDYLEKALEGPIDYDRIRAYWTENLCY